MLPTSRLRPTQHTHGLDITVPEFVSPSPGPSCCLGCSPIVGYFLFGAVGMYGEGRVFFPALGPSCLHLVNSTSPSPIKQASWAWFHVVWFRGFLPKTGLWGQHPGCGRCTDGPPVSRGFSLGPGACHVGALVSWAGTWLCLGHLQVVLLFQSGIGRSWTGVSLVCYSTLQWESPGPPAPGALAEAQELEALFCGGLGDLCSLTPGVRVRFLSVSFSP